MNNYSDYHAHAHSCIGSSTHCGHVRLIQQLWHVYLLPRPSVWVVCTTRTLYTTISLCPPVSDKNSRWQMSCHHYNNTPANILPQVHLSSVQWFPLPHHSYQRYWTPYMIIRILCCSTTYVWQYLFRCYSQSTIYTVVNTTGVNKRESGDHAVCWCVYSAWACVHTCI